MFTPVSQQQNCFLGPSLPHCSCEEKHALHALNKLNCLDDDITESKRDLPAHNVYTWEHKRIISLSSWISLVLSDFIRQEECRNHFLSSKGRYVNSRGTKTTKDSQMKVGTFYTETFNRVLITFIRYLSINGMSVAKPTSPLSV